MKCSMCGKTYYNYTRTFDSRRCYRNWVWKRRWRKIKTFLGYVLGFSIMLVGYLLLNYLIWAIETYIN